MKFLAPWMNGLVSRLTCGDETAARLHHSQVRMWRWSWRLKRAMEGIWKLLSADWGCHQYLVRFVCIDLVGTCIKMACRVFAYKAILPDKRKTGLFEMQVASVSLTIHWLCYTLLSPRSWVDLELFSTNPLPVCKHSWSRYCPLQATLIYSPTLSLKNRMFTYSHIDGKIWLYKKPHKQDNKNIKNVKGCRDDGKKHSNKV